MVNWTLAHAAFNIKDYDKSMEFYADKLGFKKQLTLYTADDKVWLTYVEMTKGQFLEPFPIVPEYKVWIDAEKTDLFVGKMDVNNVNKFAHLCIVVDNIEELGQTLQKKGVQLWFGSHVFGRKEKVPYKGELKVDYTKSFYIADPAGTSIEFMEYTPECFQLAGDHPDRLNGVKWGIGHIALNVPNYEECVDFYVNMLGLEKKTELRDSQGNPQGCYLEMGEGQYIVLYPMKARAVKNSEGTEIMIEAPEKPGFNHICLTVDDLAKVAEDLGKKEITLYDPTLTRKLTNAYEQLEDETGNHCFYIKDPDDILIRMIEKRRTDR